jgi:DNA repair exonuclease SbcCD nuclease subunit
MRYAILGDLHIGTRSGNEAFLDFQMNWLEYFLDECQKRNVDKIVQLGDFFDVRKSTDNQVLYALVNQFIPMVFRSKIKWEVLVGNHDIYYKNTNRVNTIDILEKLINNQNVFKSINAPTTDGEPYSKHCVAYVPWINEENIDTLVKYCLPEANYVFGHLELSGYPMYSGMNSVHGLDSSIFKDKNVFSGHFHTISEKDNITYCGSPYHLTWSDEVDGTNRGFWILDTETGEHKLVKNNESQTLFVRYEYNDNLDYENNSIKELVSGKIVKVFVNKKENKKNFQTFVKLLNSYSIISLSIIDNTIIKLDESVTEESVNLESSVVELIEKYCDNQENVSLEVKEKTLELFRKASA